jgi:ferredoxin
VSDLVERRVAGLMVRIDRLLCVGFGDCIEVAPDLWEFDDDGIVVFVDPLPDVDRDRLIASCESCPVDALSVHDDDGNQLAPRA